MSLLFGGAVSDRVNHGSAAALDNLTAWTQIFWLYPTTLTSFLDISDKQVTSNGRRLVFVSGYATSDVEIQVRRATNADDYSSNGAGITVNNWWYVAVVYDSAAGAGLHAKFYVGNLTTPAALKSTIVDTEGSGALKTDAAGDFIIGNDYAFASSYRGRIAFHGNWNITLSLGQIKAQQYDLLYPVDPDPAHCLIFTNYGLLGTGTQPDWSGNLNNGTVTGATQSNHVPLPLFPYQIWTPSFVPPGGYSPALYAKYSKFPKFIMRR
jgi:hypothetical protein